MCCDVRIDAGTKCWSSGKGDYHVGHVTGAEKYILNWGEGTEGGVPLSRDSKGVWGSAGSSSAGPNSFFIFI